MQHNQHEHRKVTIEIGDDELNYRTVEVGSDTQTGAQIALAAGYKPDDGAIVLMQLPTRIEDVSPEEEVTLEGSGQRFIVGLSDRTYNFTVDGIRFPWLRPVIKSEVIRQLAGVSPDKRLLLERVDEADLEITLGATVDLDAPGTEQLITRPGVWKLNVQGKVLEIHSPTIQVRQALVLANFDPNGNWLIFLKVEGQGKRAMGVNDVIDLTTPGIEKLRLTPADVSNGEVAVQPQRQFELLPVDVQHLEGMGYHWETRVEPNQQRWVIIHNYPLPAGYSSETVEMALLIPVTYPMAQIDMFYVWPAIQLSGGGVIPNVEITAVIEGRTFQGWSRHRSWNPGSDNVVTQLSMVDGCLLKEVEK